MILIDLIYNLTLLIALSVVSGFIDNRWSRKTRRGAILQGVLFGGAAVIGMLRPFVFAPGLIFDGRSVMISLGSLFFGPWTAAAACLMTIPLRIAQGGPGTGAGVLVILSSALIGIAYHLRLRRNPVEISPAMLMGFGVAVHLAMLAMMIALPADLILPVLKRIGWPVMLTYPLATVLIGKILSDQSSRNSFVEALRQSEEKYTKAFQSSPDAVLITRLRDGAIIEVNDGFFRLSGYLSQEVLGKSTLSVPLWVSEIDRNLHIAALREHGHVHGQIFQFRIKSGEMRTGSLSAEIITINGEACTLSVVRDITESQRIENSLRESERKYRELVENANTIILRWDRQGKITFLNEYGQTFFGYSEAEILGRNVLGTLVPETETTGRDLRPLMEQICADPAVFESNINENIRRDGSRVWISWHNKTVKGPDGQVVETFSIGSDITERKRAEEALVASLGEKETLLKEVHHRVKNNLQIISSLLNLQARQLQNAEVQVFLRDTQSRIQAMALLHETLYGSDNLARVSFRRYVTSVCAHVARSFASDSRNIRLRPDIADVALPLDQAIPAGLIINELVSNALKHAFEGRLEGEITVQLRRQDESRLVLRVADNGTGMAALPPQKNNTSLGLRLVETLVRQLGGEMTVNGDSGADFQIVFPVSPD
jgi:PAS domain S-box-containing protein